MPPVSTFAYAALMEGNAVSRLAEYERAHPDVSICRVDGVLYAWAPGWCPQVGRLAHGDDEDELLAKLLAGAGG